MEEKLDLILKEMQKQTKILLSIESRQEKMDEPVKFIPEDSSEINQKCSD